MPGKPQRPIRSRWDVLRRVYWRPLARASLIVYAAISLISTLGSEFASPHTQKLIRFGNHIPHLSPWVWATVGLALVLMLGFEGAVREFRQLDQSHREGLPAAALASVPSAASPSPAMTPEGIRANDREALRKLKRDGLVMLAGLRPDDEHFAERHAGWQFDVAAVLERHNKDRWRSRFLDIQAMNTATSMRVIQISLENQLKVLEEAINLW